MFALACPALKNITYGSYSDPSCHRNDTRTWQECVFTCDDGYNIMGPNSSTCLPTGMWNLTHLPQCAGENKLTIKYSQMSIKLYIKPGYYIINLSTSSDPFDNLDFKKINSFIV